MERNGGIGSISGRSYVGNPAEQRRVGLIYDSRMCNHANPDEEGHPESPNRIRAIWDILQSAGIAQRCVVLNAKEASDKCLALVHTKKHINLIKNISSRKSGSRKKRSRVASKFDSVYFNEGSSQAAYLAAGSVIEAAEKVAKGELDSAFAIVRPPGHHAEVDEPMGFCLYNNVAIAASYLLNEQPKLGIRKVLIVDWDVHHGNGTQNVFYDDPRVLFFSVHRYENGNFFPGGDDGSYSMIGEGPGAGYNINVPWENGGCGDADYIAVWDNILIPVAKEFCPDVIIISAGFDAALGDPLGQCCISPYGYSVMLEKLMDFAGGKIIMALEGGYNLDSLANSAKACVEVLLEVKNNVAGSLEAYPLESTTYVIQEVREQLGPYWQTLAVKLPNNVISKRVPLFEISSSNSDMVNEEIQEQEASTGSSWRSVLEPLLIDASLLSHKKKYSNVLPLDTEETIFEGGRFLDPKEFDGTPVLDWLRCMEWDKVMFIREKIYAALIKQFFANLRYKRDKRNDLVLKSTVDGVHIKLTCARVNKILGTHNWRRRFFCFQGWCIDDWIDLDEMISIFWNGEVLDMCGGKNAYHGLCDIHFKILHKLIVGTLLSRNGTTDMSVLSASLLYATIKKRKFNVGHFILENMVSCYTESGNSLPYGMIFTKIFRFFGVKLEEDDSGRDYSSGKGLLSINVLKSMDSCKSKDITWGSSEGKVAKRCEEKIKKLKMMSCDRYSSIKNMIQQQDDKSKTKLRLLNNTLNNLHLVNGYTSFISGKTP